MLFNGVTIHIFSYTFYSTFSAVYVFELAFSHSSALIPKIHPDFNETLQTLLYARNTLYSPMELQFVTYVPDSKRLYLPIDMVESAYVFFITTSSSMTVKD